LAAQAAGVFGVRASVFASPFSSIASRTLMHKNKSRTSPAARACITIHDRPHVGTALSSLRRVSEKYRVHGGTINSILLQLYNKVSRFLSDRGTGWSTRCVTHAFAIDCICMCETVLSRTPKPWPKLLRAYICTVCLCD
jgi:hypothetical protein